MRRFKFTLDKSRLGLQPGEEKKLPSDKKIFENILTGCLNARYETGIPGTKALVFARILDQLDSAPGEVLQLEEREYEFVRDALKMDDKIKIPAGESRTSVQLYENVEAAEKVKVK